MPKSKKNDKIPLSRKGSRFRGDLWLDRKIHPRTINALRGRGIVYKENENPRNKPEYKKEYQLQLRLFRQSRNKKKEEMRIKQQMMNEAAKAAKGAESAEQPQGSETSAEEESKNDGKEA